MDLGFLNNPLFQMGAGMLSQGGRMGPGIQQGLGNVRQQQQLQMQQQQMQQQAAAQAMRQRYLKLQMDVANRAEQARQKAAQAFMVPGATNQLPGPPDPGTGMLPTQTMPSRAPANMEEMQAGMMRMAAADPATYAAQAYKMNKPDLVNVPAGGTMFDRNTMEPVFSNPAAATSGGYGLNPVWGVDKDGNAVVMQLSNQGGVRPVTMPGGVTPTKPLQTMKLGGEVVTMEPLSGKIRGRHAKSVPPEQTVEHKADVAGAQVTSKALATAGAEAQINLPAVKHSASTMARHIKGLLEHPGREIRTGFSSIFPAIPGTSGAGFDSRLKQLKGGTFMKAYETLKGGGQITEVEGKKAEESLARLHESQSEEEFIASANEYLQDIMDLVALAERKASGKRSSGAGGWGKLKVIEK